MKQAQVRKGAGFQSGAQGRAIRFTAVLAILACSLLGVRAASAQEVTAKDGLGSGKLRLHPGIFLEGGFDSNIFREDEQESPTGAPLVLVRPTFGLSLANPTNVAAELNASVLYLQYLDDSDQVLDQSGFSINGDGTLTFNPNGAVAFTLYDTFRRTNEAPNQELLAQYDRIYNMGGAKLLIQPGGKVLTLELGGAFELYRHDELTQLDRNIGHLTATGKWRFLPKTALLVEVDQRFLFYETQQRTVLASGEVPSYQDPFNAAGLRNVDSSPLRVMGGLAGLVLNRLSVVALLGYGNGFYASGPNFNGLLARAEVAYEIADTSRLRVGYERNFLDSTFANYFAYHRAYTGYKHQIAGRVDLRLDGDFELRQFSTTPGPILDQVSVDGQAGASAFSTPDRVDPVFGLESEAVVRLGDFWRIGARYNLDVNASDFVFITGSVAAQPNPADINQNGTALASFQKHRVMVFTGVEW